MNFKKGAKIMSKEFEESVLKKLEKLDTLDTILQDVVLNKLDDLEKEVKENKDSIKKLNDNFTVFDFEINKKIDTLFDAITANTEKHDAFEKSIVSLNTKTFNHDIRISVLEDYNKGAKLLVAN